MKKYHVIVDVAERKAYLIGNAPTNGNETGKIWLATDDLEEAEDFCRTVRGGLGEMDETTTV
jgi:hypothetical protein